MSRKALKLLLVSLLIALLLDLTVVDAKSKGSWIPH